jgi:hypothetical protein
MMPARCCLRRSNVRRIASVRPQRIFCGELHARYRHHPPNRRR